MWLVIGIIFFLIIFNLPAIANGVLKLFGENSKTGHGCIYVILIVVFILVLILANYPS